MSCRYALLYGCKKKFGDTTKPGVRKQLSEHKKICQKSPNYPKSEEMLQELVTYYNTLTPPIKFPPPLDLLGHHARLLCLVSLGFELDGINDYPYTFQIDEET